MVINGEAFSPDGKVLATSESDGVVQLWNTVTKKAPQPLVTDPHSYGVDAVAFSRDGTMLAAGDSNGRIYLWKLSAGKLAARKPVAALVNHGGQVTSLLAGEMRTAVFSVAFSPDGKTLATNDTNGSTYLWRVR